MIRPTPGRQVGPRDRPTPSAGPLASADACARPRHHHRARPARAAQRHHRRPGRPRRPHDAHRRRRSAGRRRGPGPDRRHRRLPRGAERWREPVFAGCHRLNGNGELTGLEWVRESGLLTTPVAITNTHSVGVVRDALVAASVEDASRRATPCWSLPVVGETYDGLLNDINGFHVRPSTCARPSTRPSAGPSPRAPSVAAPAWSATSSRAGSGPRRASSRTDRGGFTVGALVQANYGKRDWLRVDGVPVGEAIGVDEVPSPYDQDAVGRRRPPPAARARSSWSSRPTRRCSPTSASGWPSGPASGSPGRAAPAATRAATCSSRSPPATDLPADDEDRSVHAHVRRPGGRRRRHRPALRRRHRGDRGGDRQRPGRGRDDDRPRRHHGPRAAPRPAARGRWRRYGRGPRPTRRAAAARQHASPRTRLRPAAGRQPAATGAGFSIGTPIRLPYSVHEPS